jgi:hypothetical protein
MGQSLNKNVIDVVQTFSTYMTFCGDVERTSLALNLPPQTIRDLAKSEQWDSKLDEFQKLRTGDPRELQVQINRTVNYVQAHRLRSIVDKIISHFQGMEAEEIINVLTETSASGSKFSSRPLADLVKAAEACQAMTSRALGDTPTETPVSPGNKSAGVALMVMRAMEAAEQTGLDSVQVVRKEFAIKS